MKGFFLIIWRILRKLRVLLRGNRSLKLRLPEVCRSRTAEMEKLFLSPSLPLVLSL